MKSEHYLYNCSKEYITSINLNLFNELSEIISILPKRQTQSEINKDFILLLGTKGWSYDSFPSSLSENLPGGLPDNLKSISEIKKSNKRQQCITSTTLGARWYADFAKIYGERLVQIEVQFGTVESMFKDFCGFKIASYEKRLSLGIEVVLCEPNKYFAHRKTSIAGMAYFDIAKCTLPAIGFDCPIWLIGIKE